MSEPRTTVTKKELKDATDMWDKFVALMKNSIISVVVVLIVLGLAFI